MSGVRLKGIAATPRGARGAAPPLPASPPVYKKAGALRRTPARFLAVLVALVAPEGAKREARPSTIRKLAKVLGVEPQEIIGG